MKSILKLTLILLSFLVVACSSSDDSSDANQIDSQIIGKWYFGNPLIVGLETNNSFTFNANGEVVYSYWSGGADFDFLTETGTYSFNGDIMTMIFPEGVTLTFVQRVEFITDNIVEFIQTSNPNENAYEGDYFRDGADNYDLPPTVKEYEIRISGESSSSQQYPLVIEYYSDDENGQVFTEIVNSQTNTDIIQNLNLESFNIIGFEYDVTGYEDSVIYEVQIKDVETNTILFSNSSLSIEDNEVFTYNISEDSFTVQ